jgi:hypothetical protein
MAQTSKKLRALMDEYERTRTVRNDDAVTLADTVADDRTMRVNRANRRARGEKNLQFMAVFTTDDFLCEYEGSQQAFRDVCQRIAVEVGLQDLWITFGNATADVFVSDLKRVAKERA